MLGGLVLPPPLSPNSYTSLPPSTPFRLFWRNCVGKSGPEGVGVCMVYALVCVGLKIQNSLLWNPAHLPLSMEDPCLGTFSPRCSAHFDSLIALTPYACHHSLFVSHLQLRSIRETGSGEGFQQASGEAYIFPNMYFLVVALPKLVRFKASEIRYSLYYCLRMML